MNKVILISSLMVFSFYVQAQDSDQPCMQIKKACEAAGFQKGKAREGKGLVKDCMSRLTNGESVSGVSLSSSVISACKEKHEK